MADDTTRKSGQDTAPTTEDRPTASSVTHYSTEVVDQWFSEFIPNSPVSATVASWNHVYAAKEELKRRLAKETA